MHYFWLVFFAEVCFYALLFDVCTGSDFRRTLIVCMAAFISWYVVFHGGDAMFFKYMRICMYLG